MGRSPAQLSAPQAAVLLAVLALSAAAPGTAALDRPKEAGPTGCATVDRMMWPDAPKEALTIFDMVAPSRQSHIIHCVVRPPGEKEKDVGTAGASRLGRDRHGVQDPHGNGRQKTPGQGEPHGPRPELDEHGTPPRQGQDGPAIPGRQRADHAARAQDFTVPDSGNVTIITVTTLATLTAMLLALAAAAVTARWAGYGRACTMPSARPWSGARHAGAGKRKWPRWHPVGPPRARTMRRREGGAAPGAANAPGWWMPRPMRRTQHMASGRHSQRGGRRRADTRGVSRKDGAAGCTMGTSTGVHSNVRPKDKKKDKKQRPVRRRHHHGRLPGLRRAGMLLGIVTLSCMTFPGHSVRNPIPTRPAKTPDPLPGHVDWATWTPDGGWDQTDGGRPFRFAARDGGNAADRRLDVDMDAEDHDIPAEEIWAIIVNHRGVRGAGDGHDGVIEDPVELQYAFLWDWIQRDGFRYVEEECPTSSWYWNGNGAVHRDREQERPRLRWSPVHGFIDEEGLPEWMEAANHWAEMDDTDQRMLLMQIAEWTGTFNHDPFDVDVLASVVAMGEADGTGPARALRDAMLGARAIETAHVAGLTSGGAEEPSTASRDFDPNSNRRRSMRLLARSAAGIAAAADSQAARNARAAAAQPPQPPPPPPPPPPGEERQAAGEAAAEANHNAGEIEPGGAVVAANAPMGGAAEAAAADAAMAGAIQGEAAGAAMPGAIQAEAADAAIQSAEAADAATQSAEAADAARAIDVPAAAAAAMNRAAEADMARAGERASPEEIRRYFALLRGAAVLRHRHAELTGDAVPSPAEAGAAEATAWIARGASAAEAAAVARAAEAMAADVAEENAARRAAEMADENAAMANENAELRSAISQLQAGVDQLRAENEEMRRRRAGAQGGNAEIEGAAEADTAIPGEPGSDLHTYLRMRREGAKAAADSKAAADAAAEDAEESEPQEAKAAVVGYLEFRGMHIPVIEGNAAAYLASIYGTAYEGPASPPSGSSPAPWISGEQSSGSGDTGGAAAGSGESEAARGPGWHTAPPTSPARRASAAERGGSSPPGRPIGRKRERERAFMGAPSTWDDSNGSASHVSYSHGRYVPAKARRIPRSKRGNPPTKAEPQAKFQRFRAKRVAKKKPAPPRDESPAKGGAAKAAGRPIDPNYAKAARAAAPDATETDIDPNHAKAARAAAPDTAETDTSRGNRDLYNRGFTYGRNYFGEQSARQRELSEAQGAVYNGVVWEYPTALRESENAEFYQGWWDARAIYGNYERRTLAGERHPTDEQREHRDRAERDRDGRRGAGSQRRDEDGDRVDDDGMPIETSDSEDHRDDDDDGGGDGGDDDEDGIRTVAGGARDVTEKKAGSSSTTRTIFGGLEAVISLASLSLRGLGPSHTSNLNTTSCYFGRRGALRGTGCLTGSQAPLDDAPSTPTKEVLPDESKWGNYWHKARRLEKIQQGLIKGILTVQGPRMNLGRICLMIAEIVGLIAAVAMMHTRNRRRRDGARNSSQRYRSKGQRNAKKRDSRKAPYTTEPIGHRKWQRHVEDEAMKAGIGVAMLLGWIASPNEAESKTAAGSTDEASQVIGIARRQSSLGLERVNSQERVTAARRALAEAEAARAADFKARTDDLLTAQTLFAQTVDSKVGDEDFADQIAQAKAGLANAQRAMGEGGERHEATIEALRKQLEDAVIANSAAPEDQPATTAVAAHGEVDGAKVKDLLAPLKLATQSNMTKDEWQYVWPTLKSELQKRLWSRGQSQLYQIILDTLDDTQKMLITAANANDQQDGLMAYKILRKHCYGSREEWISRLWKAVQNWSQDRGAKQELGRPRKLLDAIMILEADIADFEETGEVISEQAKLIILKEGLARRQRKALEKIKDDLSGEHWDYRKTVNWLLTWDRKHQLEVKQGEADLMSSWRSRPNPRQGARATANLARGAPPGGAKKRGRCYICGKEGHWARECPSKAAANAANAQRGGQGGRNTFRCYNCGKTGHAARDCPLPRQSKKCFTCGSDKHLQKDCPQNNRQGGGKGGGSRQGGNNRQGGGGRRGGAKRGAARAAVPKPLSLSREELKTLVKHANKHRDTADFKLTKNKATGKIVVAGSKPAPTTLMLIPMPIDPRAKEALAATLSENNATLPIMDSGASKNTVPLWYELSNERDADIDIQCAGEDQVLKCETEGEDGVLGTSMKIKTGTPLLAIRPLDERGVATVFMGNKVYALTTSHMMALVEGAVAGGYGHIVGHAKPEWVYELTDRRALESVVRAADAGRAHVADDANGYAAAPRRLKQQRGPTFDDLGFDPEVRPGENYEDRMRQYRNAIQRHKGKTSAAAESAAADLEIPALDNEGCLSGDGAPGEPNDNGNGSVEEVDSDQSDGDSGSDVIDMSDEACPLCGAPGCDPTWCDGADDTPPSTPQDSSTARDKAPDAPQTSRSNIIVAGSPLAKNLGGAMAAAAERRVNSDAAGVSIARLSLGDEAAKKRAVAKTITVKPRPRAPTPFSDMLRLPAQVPEPLDSTGGSTGEISRLSIGETSHRRSGDDAMGRKRRRSHGKLAGAPKCHCNGCDRDCHFDPTAKAYSTACSRQCMNATCGHEGKSAPPPTATSGDDAPKCGRAGCDEPKRYMPATHSWLLYCSDNCHLQVQMKRKLRADKKKKRAAAKAAREAATTAAVQAAAKAQLTAAKLRSDTPRGGPEPGDDAASQTPSTPDDLADYHAMLEPRARPDPHDELERRYEQAMMTVKMTKDVLRRAVQEERPKASRISSLKKKLKKARKQASDLNTRLKKSQDALLGAGLPPKALRRHQTPSQAQISLWTDEIRAGDINAWTQAKCMQIADAFGKATQETLGEPSKKAQRMNLDDPQGGRIETYRRKLNAQGVTIVGNMVEEISRFATLHDWDVDQWASLSVDARFEIVYRKTTAVINSVRHMHGPAGKRARELAYQMASICCWGQTKALAMKLFDKLRLTDPDGPGWSQSAAVAVAEHFVRMQRRILEFGRLHGPKPMSEVIAHIVDTFPKTKRHHFATCGNYHVEIIRVQWMGWLTAVGRILSDQEVIRRLAVSGKNDEAADAEIERATAMATLRKKGSWPPATSKIKTPKRRPKKGQRRPQPQGQTVNTSRKRKAGARTMRA